MKTVLQAFFDPDGQMVVTITKGRFHGYAIDEADGELVVTKLWDQKLSQVLWIGFGADVVIASNTSDHHVAVDKKTGQVAWERPRPKRDGIRGRGIVVHDHNEERYVYTGFNYVYQVSPATGEDVEPPWPIDFWTERLHQRADGRIGAIVPAYAAAQRKHKSLAAIDLSAKTLELLLDFPAGSGALQPGLPGTGLIVEARPTPDSRALEILDLPSMESRAFRLLGDPQIYLYEATWSHCGRWIGLGTTFGYVILPSDLSQAIEMPYGRGRGLPAFHPNSEHVLLPRDAKTRIERIDHLAATYGPAGPAASA